MTSTFQDILARAEAEKARKQADYQALVSRVYRQDEKQTSQISLKNHQSRVDEDTPDKIEDSLSTLTTERSAMLSAGQLRAIEPNAPVLDRPNKYTNLKRCVYPDHEGDRWVNRAQFSPDKHHTDGLHSYCRACENKRKRLAYVPRWKRGT
jgi:cell pole-organizing protein PopZ